MLRVVIFPFLVFALGCAALAQPQPTERDPAEEDSGVPDPTERVPAKRLYDFSVQRVRRDGEDVIATLRIAQRPGTDTAFWGGRQFYHHHFYDVKGKPIKHDQHWEQTFNWFDDEQYKKLGYAESEYRFTPPKGTHSFAFEFVPSRDRTQRVRVPGNDL
jgi:hypothetical protein